MKVASQTKAAQRSRQARQRMKDLGSALPDGLVCSVLVHLFHFDTILAALSKLQNAIANAITQGWNVLYPNAMYITNAQKAFQDLQQAAWYVHDTRATRPLARTTTWLFKLVIKRKALLREFGSASSFVNAFNLRRCLPSPLSDRRAHDLVFAAMHAA